MKKLLALSLLALAVLLVACGSDDDEESGSTQATPQVTQQAVAPTTAATTTTAATSGYTPKKVASSVSLNGAGATFPNPFYTKAFDEYNKQVDPNVRVNYQSIGSSGGIKNFTEKTVDFGASDAFLSPEQIQAAGGAENVLQIPTVLGAIVLTYNIPNVNATLKLTPETVSGIFMGDITDWNDAKIKADNPGVNLPDAEIAVVHRSDGSGTTNAFTTYLSDVSPEWKQNVGAGTSVQWPTGIGAQGNDGVTGQVKQTPGSLGYVELSYANTNKLPVADLQNKAGKFVKPTLESTAAAAADLSSVTEDLNLNVINQPGENAYPIATATWLLLNKNYTDALKGQAIANLVWWLTHPEGQAVATPLEYAPLPKELVPTIEAKLKTMTANGAPIIQ